VTSAACHAQAAGHIEIQIFTVCKNFLHVTRQRKKKPEKKEKKTKIEAAKQYQLIRLLCFLRDMLHAGS
jgi:hypothetical protein